VTPPAGSAAMEVLLGTMLQAAAKVHAAVLENGIAPGMIRFGALFLLACGLLIGRLAGSTILSLPLSVHVDSGTFSDLYTLCSISLGRTAAHAALGKILSEDFRARLLRSSLLSVAVHVQLLCQSRVEPSSVLSVGGTTSLTCFASC
jgi:hypothetical protein